MFIDEERVRIHNDLPVKKRKYVLYWMQSAQRVKNNPALEYSVELANKQNLPLLVFFSLTKYPEANERHYYFMIEGLQESAEALENIGAQVSFQIIEPVKGVQDLSGNASVVVMDQGYTRLVRKWYQKIVEKVKCPLIQVETNIVVPVEVASDKEEYAAYTIRKKINRQRERFLHLSKINELKATRIFDLKNVYLKNVEKIIEKLEIKEKVKKPNAFIGGIVMHQNYLMNLLKIN